MLYGSMNQLVSFIEWFLEYYLPPMIANASPVLVNGRHRIDLGYMFIDGRPLLGAGKTWEGLVVGLYMGFLASIPLYIYFDNVYILLNGSIASLTALIGDMIGSFIKRRIGLKRGDPAPILDQLDFALMATLYYYYVAPGFQQRPYYILYSLLIILLLHILTNNIAYYIGVKDRRW